MGPFKLVNKIFRAAALRFRARRKRRTVDAGCGVILLVAALAPLLLFACAPRGNAAPDLDAVAERYVRLVLAMGRHDPDYVDAYYGPEAWKHDAERDSMSLPAIAGAADSLIARLGSRPAEADTLLAARRRFLARQLAAVASRARMQAGQRQTFDQESRALYDAAAPVRSDTSFAPALARLDSLLPGRGPLAQRWERFRERFVIPPARLDTVFRLAIAEARRRTRARIALPDSESFTLDFVKDRPWGGYNWYQGGAHSRIEVNVDLPIYIDRALDLACHEGYPGHHVYNALLERELVRRRGWVEFTIYPLHSPQSLIAEGTAVVAEEVAFPGPERPRFEKTVLFPAAGLDTADYERYEQVRDAVDSLSMAPVEGARRWLDGAITREQAMAWLERYAVRTPRRARQDLRFAERYRSYVVNYRLGRILVLDWLDANGGDAAHPERRWELFQELLASPRLPSDLRARGS